jgi:hypothetical protein
MDPEDVAASIEPSGLSLTDVVELPPYLYAAIFSKLTKWNCGRRHDYRHSLSRIVSTLRRGDRASRL